MRQAIFVIVSTISENKGSDTISGDVEFSDMDGDALTKGLPQFSGCINAGQVAIALELM